MNIKKLYILLLILLVSISAKSQESVEGSLNGVKFTILAAAKDAKKIKLDDIITFNFIAKTDKDSVLLSSYQMGQPAKVQVQASKNVADLMDIFPLLSINDLATVSIPTDSVFKGNDQDRPPFFPKGSSMIYTIKIENIQTIAEAMADRDKALEEIKNAEKDSVAKYIAKNNLPIKSTASGLMYVVTKASTKIMPAAGDTVVVSYVGKTLDGKLFDTSIEAEAVKGGLSQPGRVYEPISLTIGRGEVIPGWDEGILLMNEGSSATFIIPSDLGYGPQGNGAIQPFTTLLFNVELIQVKPAKK